MTETLDNIEIDDKETLDEVIDDDEFLTFRLVAEEYGVDILRVQEIRGWESVTHVPNSPGYVKGVLNLRGSIVPIIDLRIRFNMPHEDYTNTTVVIILSVNSGDRSRVMGVVVDAVSDVVTAKRTEVQATPDYGTVVDTDYIAGLAEANNKMIMLLDVDKLLNLDEFSEEQQQQDA